MYTEMQANTYSPDQEGEGLFDFDIRSVPVEEVAHPYREVKTLSLCVAPAEPDNSSM